MDTPLTTIRRAFARLGWICVDGAGATAIATIAIHRGEPINLFWPVVGAAFAYLILLCSFMPPIAHRVSGVDPIRGARSEDYPGSSPRLREIIIAPVIARFGRRDRVPPVVHRSRGADW